MSSLYPLWNLERREIIQADKTRKYNLYYISVVMQEHGDDEVLYVTHSEVFANYVLLRLKELYDSYIKDFLIFTNPEYKYVMFEYADQIYKTQYIYPAQSCVTGSQIEGNNAYGIKETDFVKHDYAVSNIFFYERDELLVKGNQVFLNGDLIANEAQLTKICEECGQDMLQLNTYPDKLLNYLYYRYPQIKTYTCEGYHLCNMDCVR